MEWPPQEVCVYILETDDDVVAVDAGVGTEDGRDDLLDTLDRHGYSPGDVDHLLLTHPHLDHVGGVDLFTEATVYAHEDVSYYLDDGEDRVEETRRKIQEAGFRGGYVDEAVEGSLDVVRQNREHLVPEDVDVELSGDERFTAGGVEFDTVHTPGHQHQHLCFEFDSADGRALFAGDAVAESFRSIIYDVGFREGMYEAVESYYTAFDRLRGRDVDVVYPGHGPVFHDLPAAVDQAEDSLDRLVERCADTLRDLGRATTFDVTLQHAESQDDFRNRIFDDAGALGYLEKQELATSELEDGVRYFEPVE